MAITELVKLATTSGIGLVVAIMVLKFMFRIVEKKFDVDSELIRKNYTKNNQIDEHINHICGAVEKISDSQVEITASQAKIVTLIDSVDRRINGYKK